MKAVIQRAGHSYVAVEGERVGEITRGMVVLLGVAEDDTLEDIEVLAGKMVNLRIFEDQAGKMNRSLLEEEGEILLISQFTLFADTRKGRRPSFIKAGNPEKAREYFQLMKSRLEELGAVVETGVFQADMDVHLVNDGPVTILMDTREH